VILGTAGHIDHGKTALVKALTGVDTDRLPEEKKRGITIDLGFAPLELEGIGTVGVVDVPGHEAFVRTMLAGATGIDAALLVVAADEGVMPQTHEHVEILSLLGVTNIVAAITKADLVEEDWMALVREDVAGLLDASRIAAVAIVPVSVVTGQGITELRAALASALSNRRRARSRDDLFRMPVDRAFTVRGTGTVVTGTIWTGTIRRDATVFAHPGGRALRVRGIQTHGRPVDEATPGERAAIALANCDVAEMQRGMVLLDSSVWTPTARLLARVQLGRDAPPLTPRTRLRFHLATSDVGARLSFDAGTAVAAGSHFIAQVVLAEPVVARAGDKFVLRRPSPAATIGGGTVVDPFPAAKASRHFDASVTPDARTLLLVALDCAGGQGIDESILPIRLGVDPRRSADLVAAAGAETIEGRVVGRGSLDTLAVRLEQAVHDSVANSPLEAGVQLQTLRAELRAPAAVIDRALLRLISAERLELDGANVKPAGWSAKLSERQLRQRDAMLHEICAAASDPPSVSELELRMGSDVPALLRLLARSGEVVRVSDERYYSKGAVADLIARLRGTLDPKRSYPPSELRDVLGVSRKYLIPFLEFCDRTGVTERSANGRRILPERARPGGG